MKTTPFKVTTGKAFGYDLADLKVKEGFAPLPSSLTIEGTFEAFENHPEVVAAKEELTNDEVVNAVNAARKAAAKKKAQDAKYVELGIIEPTMENDEQLQLQTVFEGIMAGGKRTKEEARQIAETAVGAKWAK